ncbi:Arrestin domain-containing protein 3 [Manis javanica]|nr:Arrestin domain-containing protein 3 [Manis javanica]
MRARLRSDEMFCTPSARWNLVARERNTKENDQVTTFVQEETRDPENGDIRGKHVVGASPEHSNVKSGILFLTRRLKASMGHATANDIHPACWSTFPKHISAPVTKDEIKYHQQRLHLEWQWELNEELSARTPSSRHPSVAFDFSTAWQGLRTWFVTRMAPTVSSALPRGGRVPGDGVPVAAARQACVTRDLPPIYEKQIYYIGQTPAGCASMSPVAGLLSVAPGRLGGDGSLRTNVWEALSPTCGYRQKECTSDKKSPWSRALRRKWLLAKSERFPACSPVAVWGSDPRLANTELPSLEKAFRHLERNMPPFTSRSPAQTMPRSVASQAPGGPHPP